MTLRERLMSGETISPEDGTPKTTITSTVSQLRRQGVEIETLGNCQYRLSENGNGNGRTSSERPPMPGEHLMLDLTVTGLRLDEDNESLLVTASDGTHEFEFPW